MRSAFASCTGLALFVFGFTFGCDKSPSSPSSNTSATKATESSVAVIKSAKVNAAVSAAPTGSAINENSYKVEIRPVGTYKKGAPSSFEVFLTTKSDYHVNEEFPIKLKLKPTSGVDYPKDKIDKTSGAVALEACSSGKDKCTMRMTVGFTPQNLGKIEVGGELSVSICNAATCLIEKPNLIKELEIGS